MRRHQPWLVVVLVAAVVGVVFAGVSTYDFVQHLDRQVHNLHCSFIPGVSHSGESGCQVAMMSPYSSVLRAQVWGGIPISLAAMSVFAFLAFYAIDLVVTRRKDYPRATGFLALATALPALTSAVMLAISISKLGTTCKLCVCIYAASAVCFVGGMIVWRAAVRERGDAPPEPVHRERYHGEPAFVGRGKAASSGGLVAVGEAGAPVSGGFLVGMFAIGVAFVAIPVVLYAAMAPDHARFIGTCESLAHPDDTYGVMVRVERGGKGVPAIEVLDPLCPACRAFEQRLAASGLGEQLDRKAVLFPLDKPCNWMVTEATHPGACTVSEAVLCAGDKAPDVIAWAFDNQEQIRDAARADPDAAARIVKQRFPQLASCVGSPDARSRLNKSMRWIVANNIRVLTPQVFIDKVKLCDEDVDLGLEYTLSNMLARHAAGTLAGVPLEKPAPAAAGSASAQAPDKAPPKSEGAASERPAAQASPDKPAAEPAAPASGSAESGDKGSASPPAEGNAHPDEAAPDKASADKASSDKASSNKASSDKATPDKAPSDKASSDKAPSDKAPSDKASSDNAPSEKAPSDKAAADKAPSEKASSDKASADKASSNKASSDKATPDKASSDKASPDKASSDKPAGEPAGDKTPRKPAVTKPPRRPAPKPARRPAPETVPDTSGPVTHPGDSQ